MWNRALYAALLLAATPALTGNSLVNPGFDNDLSGWAYVGTAQWDSSDALSQTSSGSAVGTNNATTPFTYTHRLTAPCVPVIPAARHYDSICELPPVAQAGTPVPSLEIAWYSGTSCGALTFLSANSLVDGNTADGVWHRAESTYAPIAPANATFASFRLNLSKLEAGGTATAYYDNPVFKPAGTCGTTPDRLCLNNDRFQVTSTYLNYAGQSGVGKAQAMTADTGYFWFFSAANVEVVIKVINGCGFNSAYWIYAGGLTDVDVQIEVKDTRSSTVKHYGNTLGTPFQPIGDIQAFATCP